MFYLNKEFSESTDKEKKEPEYKVEIEKTGKDTGVIVEWRVRSPYRNTIGKARKTNMCRILFWWR